MAAPYTANEEAQLLQTIEMFEVITQSQPQDYQSLEILKEAYLKLNRAPQSARYLQANCVGLRAIGPALVRHHGI